MKNYVLIASLCLISTLAVGQTKKGQGFWSGSLGFNNLSIKSNQNSLKGKTYILNSNVSISRGLFFKENWQVGGDLRLSWARGVANSTVPASPDYFAQNGFLAGMGGYIRRYWGKEKWRVFLGGGLSIDYSNTTISFKEATASTDPDKYFFAVKPFTQVGANYYLTDRIGLEATASSGSFSLVVNGFSLGLVVLTSVNKRSGFEKSDAPQTNKGKRIVGGSFEFDTQGSRPNTQNALEERSNTFIISPSAGWFVKKNILLGFSLPLGVSWNKNGAIYQYGFNPYLKKYITENRLRPFTDGNLTYKAIRSNSDGDKGVTQQDAGIGARAGLAYMLGDRFIVEALLGQISFNRTFYPENAKVKVWSGNFSASLQPGFTINYVFD